MWFECLKLPIRYIQLLFIFILTIGITSVKGQVSGYTLEWNEQKVGFSTVLGLEGTSQTTLSRFRLVPGTSTTTLKTVTLQKIRCNTESDLFRWFSSFSQTTRVKQDVRIKLVNQYGEIIKAWRITQAGPAKMDVPQPLNAEANMVLIENLTLTYEKIEPDW